MKLDNDAGQAEFASRFKALIEECGGRYVCGAAIVTDRTGEPLAFTVINTNSEGGVAIMLTGLSISQEMSLHPEACTELPEFN